mmetsp:Transcript_16139/g.44698  ORF Transcript_16139/g.44698 Transcript_16139/m.44698 type:complete len:250 (+) Transcript_16139:1722-2471(+)
MRARQSVDWAPIPQIVVAGFRGRCRRNHRRHIRWERGWIIRGLTGKRGCASWMIRWRSRSQRRRPVRVSWLMGISGLCRWIKQFFLKVIIRRIVGPPNVQVVVIFDLVRFIEFSHFDGLEHVLSLFVHGNIVPWNIVSNHNCSVIVIIGIQINQFLCCRSRCGSIPFFRVCFRLILCKVPWDVIVYNHHIVVRSRGGDIFNHSVFCFGRQFIVSVIASFCKFVSCYHATTRNTDRSLRLTPATIGKFAT